MNISIDENKFYGYVYDGIWAIALALNRVDSKLKYYSWLAETGKAKLKPELEGLSSLLDFDYHKPIWVKLIREALNKTRFNGVTVSVFIRDYSCVLGSTLHYSAQILYSSRKSNL